MVTVVIYHLFSIEVLAPGTACLGLAFLVPGMMLIVGGQNYLQKEEIKINFLIYKDEEKQFIHFAKHTYRSKIISKLQLQQGDEGEDLPMADEQEDSEF